MLTISDYRIQWVCECCASTLTGNDVCAHDTGLCTGNPWTSHDVVSARIGVPFAEHYCDGPDIDLSCACDFKDFSGATCDGCGNQESGERYAVTLTD